MNTEETNKDIFTLPDVKFRLNLVKTDTSCFQAEKK